MSGTNFSSTLSDGAIAVLTNSTGVSGNDTGAVILAYCSGAAPATANIYAPGCIMQRTDTSALYQNTGTTASPVWTLIDTAVSGAATSLVDSNQVTAVSVGTTASAVNGLIVTDSATGAVSANAVAISTAGSDSAISLSIAPKGATGIVTVGGAAGTGDIVLGSSSATQSVKLANGAGAATVNLANTSVAGANLNVATAATGAGITDTVAISTGNAAATGIKVVNILTGTPGTSGNNRATIGGGATSAVTVNAAFTSYQAVNFIATETGGNNAIVGALLNAAGVAVTVAAGLRVVVKLAHSLQAGANTFNLNSHGTDSIKLSSNPASDLSTAFVSGGLIDLMFDGTVWQCMGAQ